MGKDFCNPTGQYRETLCLRCGSEMKHYPLHTKVQFIELPKAPNLLSSNTQTLHGIRSVYVCDTCGYVEFSMRECECYNG